MLCSWVLRVPSSPGAKQVHGERVDNAKIVLLCLSINTINYKDDRWCRSALAYVDGCLDYVKSFDQPPSADEVFAQEPGVKDIQCNPEWMAGYT